MNKRNLEFHFTRLRIFAMVKEHQLEHHETPSAEELVLLTNYSRTTIVSHLQGLAKAKGLLFPCWPIPRRTKTTATANIPYGDPLPVDLLLAGNLHPNLHCESSFHD